MVVYLISIRQISKVKDVQTPRHLQSYGIAGKLLSEISACTQIRCNSYLSLQTTVHLSEEMTLADPDCLLELKIDLFFCKRSLHLFGKLLPHRSKTFAMNAPTASLITKA
eukprot:765483-Hanusia_phi.AAC.2